MLSPADHGRGAGEPVRQLRRPRWRHGGYHRRPDPLEGRHPRLCNHRDPRTDGEGYTYRKLLRVDLQEDRCEVLKSDQDGWQLGEGPLSSQLAAFAEEGSVHSDDKDRFLAFTSLEALRAAARSGPGGRACSTAVRRGRSCAGT